MLLTSDQLRFPSFVRVSAIGNGHIHVFPRNPFRPLTTDEQWLVRRCAELQGFKTLSKGGKGFRLSRESNGTVDLVTLAQLLKLY